MSQIFISYVEEDNAIARQIADGLEQAGYTTWYYERDSLPGPSYLIQIAQAIEQCLAMVLIISRRSLGSRQVTHELVRGLESGKPFVPVLKDLSHAEFQQAQPEWRGALGAAASIRIPHQGVAAIIPRLLAGLQTVRPSPPHADPQHFSGERTSEAWTALRGALKVRLQPIFDQNAYWAREDPMARFLLELELQAAGESQAYEPQGISADIFLVLDVSGSMDAPDRYPLLRQAVEQFLRRMEPDDRVGIVLFSTGADLALRPLPGAKVADQVPLILQRMDSSGIKFGGETRLAPGLRSALDCLGAPELTTKGVQRVYVLTDGELHDSDECKRGLLDFRPRGVEIHVYGFGTQFDALSLKRLVSDQLGGSVKPICNEQDIVKTFAHVADVNRRLVAREGMLTLDFAPAVTCGDAWTFRPQERYLGPIKNRRLVRELGGLEAERVYSLLLEVRLPPDDRPHTPVAQVQLTWRTGENKAAVRVEVAAARILPGTSHSPQLIPQVGQAYAILNGMRLQGDKEAQVAAVKARRELAILEGREAGLIDALDQQIEVLGGKTSPAQINEQQLQYLASDPLTWKEVEPPPDTIGTK